MSETVYVVQPRDAQGRDLYPGLSFAPGRLVAVGERVTGGELPRGSVKGLIRRGVIAPAPPDPEEG